MTKTWSFLRETYGISIPNRAHIIMAHVDEYIFLTGHSLGRVSDQVVESAHSALNKRLERSNYWVKDLESDIHGLKLYKGILHFNSYNI